MKLELATFPVKDVQLSKRTSLNNGVLTINKDELTALILEDKRVESVDLDLAFPGEKTRIVKIRDGIEPRVKVSGQGCVFPGILGPLETVGEGRTHTMPGVTVIPSAEYTPTLLGGTASANSGLVDMWGPGAQVTPFGSTINIVLIFKLIEGVTELEAHAAIQLAEFKVGRHLAELTWNMAPENVEVFELFEVDPSLPRIVYNLGCRTTWHEPHSLVAYYGLPIRESLPTFMHPNEILDGALTKDTRRGGGMFITTWEFMNQPVVLELLRAHGKRLNFLGVIMQRTRFESEFGKQITALAASQLAKLLRADGAVITRMVTSGNNFVDLMLTVQAYEKKGIKTVFITPEWGGKNGNELPLVFYVPEATALVSTGSFEREPTLPAPDKVIGAKESELVQLYDGDQKISPWGELKPPTWSWVTGGVDWFGNLKNTCAQR